MTDLDVLRGTLTSDQRSLLATIWSHYIKEGHSLLTRILHLTISGGKKIARFILAQLGGSIIYEQEEDGILHYALTSLGLLLSFYRELAEKYLMSYPRLVQNLALKEPNRTRVSSHEAGEYLSLTHEELSFLGKALTLSLLTGGVGHLALITNGTQYFLGIRTIPSSLFARMRYMITTPQFPFRPMGE